MTDMTKTAKKAKTAKAVKTAKTGNGVKNEKETLMARFNESYPGKRLLAIHLNGFSHTVFWDEGEKGSKPERGGIHADSISFCMGEKERRMSYGDSQCDRLERVFKGYEAHWLYQGNAREILFVDRNTGKAVK